MTRSECIFLLAVCCVSVFTGMCSVSLTLCWDVLCRFCRKRHLLEPQRWKRSARETAKSRLFRSSHVIIGGVLVAILQNNGLFSFFGKLQAAVKSQNLPAFANCATVEFILSSTFLFDLQPLHPLSLTAGPPFLLQSATVAGRPAAQTKNPRRCITDRRQVSCYHGNGATKPTARTRSVTGATADATGASPTTTFPAATDAARRPAATGPRPSGAPGTPRATRTFRAAAFSRSRTTSTTPPRATTTCRRTSNGNNRAGVKERHVTFLADVVVVFVCFFCTAVFSKRYALLHSAALAYGAAIFLIVRILSQCGSSLRKTRVVWRGGSRFFKNSSCFFSHTNRDDPTSTSGWNVSEFWLVRDVARSAQHLLLGIRHAMKAESWTWVRCFSLFSYF